MGEFYYVYSGASSPDDLPFHPKGLDAILVNAPGVIESDYSAKKINTLIGISRAPKKFLDSGGFTLFRIEQSLLKKPSKEGKEEIEGEEDTLSTTQIIFDRDRPVKGTRMFNLTPAHVARACRTISADVTICPDLPIPPVDDRGEQEYQWMKSYTYNLWCAREMLELRKKQNLSTEIFLPVQCYTLAQMRRFLDDLNSAEEIDGYSLPNRILTHMATMPLFFLEFYQMKVKKVHVLGVSSFSKIAIASFFAKNLFESTSVDATSAALWARKGLYMKPYNLRDINVNAEKLLTDDDERIFRTCTCRFCRDSTIRGVQNDLSQKEKVRHLTSHNYFVLKQAMDEFYDHADTVGELIDFLLEKTRRDNEIKQIEDVLVKSEFYKGKIDAKKGANT
jgi:tRNA-guanine family transglycosylase